MENINYRIKTSNILIIMTILSFIGCGLFTNTSKSTSKNKNVLTREEIKQLSIKYTVTNAYDLVNTARPNWLLYLRGEIVVFHNGMQYGGPESLRDFHLPNVFEIRRVGLEGSSKYVRSHHPTVVILVETR